ncbi:MAG: hypothetical protein K6E18_00790 [Lachnospiraceae bacterium]|nr:hypothetical protein [Lachnospiraceae bacterium]
MDILFAENSEKQYVQLRPETIKDLALNEIIESIAATEKDRPIISSIFTRIPSDIRDIRFRQSIMRDFLKHDTLTEEVADTLGMIQTLKDYHIGASRVSQGENTLYALLESLRELSVYVAVSEQLVNILKKYDIESDGLKSLLSLLENTVGDEHFEEAKQDIETMLADLSTVKGAVIGVNFTADLGIESVAAVEFVSHKLRSKYTFAEIAANIGNIMSFSSASNSVRMNADTIRVIDPLLVNLTPLMEKELKKHFSRIKNFLKKYINPEGTFITEMYEGLTFYTAMARFGKRVKEKGNPICFPHLPLSDEKVPAKDTGSAKSHADAPSPSKDGNHVQFSIKDLYNIRLVLAGEEHIVKNDFAFTPSERLFILTGPNRGGKTIIEQALGIISVMASVGGFVTASECTGRPFSNILTHFPIDENLTINYGRLGEEAVRIKEIVKEADERTLILFNETYSTTSAGDGLYLSKDLLHVLKEIGASVIFNTHIHDVARSVEEMNQWEGQSRFVSLVMEIRDGVNTFKIKRSDPDTRSYAENIARKYGITYEQMALRDRACP